MKELLIFIDTNNLKCLLRYDQCCKARQDAHSWIHGRYYTLKFGSSNNKYDL